MEVGNSPKLQGRTTKLGRKISNASTPTQCHTHHAHSHTVEQRAMDDESGGLFSIALSDSETEDTSKVAPRDRTGQTLEEWQEIKATYRAKVENGEVSSELSLR